LDHYFLIHPILGRIRDGKVKDKQLFYGATRKRAGLYTGPVVKLHPHGFGMIKFGTICTLEGEWKEGKINGPAIQIFTNGAKFEGELKDDAGFKMFTMYHGKGKATFAGGDVYEGEYKNGQKHGHGKLTFFSGTHLEGEWEKGKMNGWGKYCGISGNTYEGDWKNDKMEGYGVYTWIGADNSVISKYEGHWKENKMDGYGKKFFYTGTRYEGEWKADKKHGFGKFFFSNGEIYLGEWKNDVTIGNGKLIMIRNI